jgi:hypothetical protein
VSTHETRPAGAGLLIAAVSVALAAAVYLARPTRLAITGDEPHYLILADSIVRDGTLDLRNGYARNTSTQHIYDGPLTPHVLIVNHRWAPYHGPGLSLVLAIPFFIGGTVGAKLSLCLIAGILPLVLYRFFSGRLSRAAAAWLTVGFVVSLPFCFGASQVFPDLVGGTVAAALACWLVESERTRRGAGGWALFWLAAGLFPWLNTKYLAATAALALWGLGVRWSRRHEDVGVARSPAVVTLLVLVGPLSLAAFHVWGVGTPFGPRGLSEVASPFSRAAEMFLGLHLDQSQGMFIQHPLLLAGVAAWPIFAWRRPRLALLWTGLYASLIVPNSMELARWGGGGPVGRFAWSAAWLWAIPIGFALAERRLALERFVKPVVIASLSYQALLAFRWLPDLRLLYPRLEESLEARDSLFPPALRPFVPSFYFWDFSSYWTYPPNLVAYACVAALVLIGALAARGGRTRASVGA